MPAQLDDLPAAARPIVAAALKTVRELKPKSAAEVPYNSKQPKSASAMWKLVRFGDAEGYVLGIGTFARHSTIFFYRGRELDDPQGLLRGSGKDTRFVTLRSSADAEQPAVKSLVRRAFRLGGGKTAGRPKSQ
ncbi:MAG TPA: hypothetical protein VKT20_11860 [Candidatus Dormibacteraeota bacterium]|nr:hypothetical protein [Candidatus Dormibacteraeota bacterium]